MTNQPNQEKIFKAMLLMMLALELEAQAFQEFHNDKIQVKVCLN
jgi:hypothetical protein